MSQQEEGWPLGLQPFNVRVGLVRSHDLNGSLSFNTLLTGSPTSSTDSSSDLDTESTGSFFHDKSITLGSLIGISSILEISRRSIRRRTIKPVRDKKSRYKSKPWLFSLCSKLSTDAAVNMNNNNTPSLGHFLEAERRAASMDRRPRSPSSYGPDDFSHVLPVSESSNSLFVGDHVAPPQSCSDNGEGSSNRELFAHSNGHGALLFSCLCGQLTH